MCGLLLFWLLHVMPSSMTAPIMLNTINLPIYNNLFRCFAPPAYLHMLLNAPARARPGVVSHGRGAGCGEETVPPHMDEGCPVTVPLTQLSWSACLCFTYPCVAVYTPPACRVRRSYFRTSWIHLSVFRSGRAFRIAFGREQIEREINIHLELDRT